MRQVIVILTLLASVFVARTQDLKISVPIRLDVGACLARLSSDPNFEISQKVGVALDVRTGITALYKNRVMLSTEAGFFLNYYDFSAIGRSYVIGQWDPRVTAHLSVLTNPINQHGSRLHIGAGLGYTFYSRDAEFEESPEYRAFTYTGDEVALLFQPEIGLSQIKEEGTFDILLFYTAHLSGEPGLTTLFDNSEGSAKAVSYNNSVGARFRYYIPLKITKPRPDIPQPVFPQLPSKEFETRNTRETHTINTKQKSVLLKIKDIADEDGDTISVSLNGQYVLYQHEITHKTKRLRLYLEEGNNRIVIYAHNEGRVPPNTARCILKAGLRKHPITVTTSLNRNQAIIVEREN